VAHVGCRTETAKGQSQPGGRTSTKSSVGVLKGIGPGDFHPRVGISKVQNLASTLPCLCQALLEVGKCRQITCNPAGLLVETFIAHGRRRRCSSAIDFGRLYCALVLVVDGGRRCVHDVELRNAQPCQVQAVDSKTSEAAADWLRCSGSRLFNETVPRLSLLRPQYFPFGRPCQ